MTMYPDQSGIEGDPLEQIPKIDEKDMQGIRVLGSGLTGTAVLVIIPDGKTGKYAVRKDPHPNMDSKHELRNEGETVAELQSLGMEGLAKLIGISPDMQKSPYLVKEFIEGQSFHLGDQKDLIPLNPNKGGLSQESLDRARWAWGMLTDVLVPMHNLKYVLGDAKTEDLILTKSTDAGGERVSVKCVDFGNAFNPDKEDKKPGPKRQRSAIHDTRNFFNILLHHGIGLEEAPDKPEYYDTFRYRNVSIDKWLAEIKAKNPDPTIVNVCEKYTTWIKERSQNSQTAPVYGDAQKLVDDLRPFFERLGVMEAPELPEIKQLREGLAARSELRGLAFCHPAYFKAAVGAVAAQFSLQANSQIGLEAQAKFMEQMLRSQYGDFDKALRPPAPGSGERYLIWEMVDSYLKGSLAFHRGPSNYGPSELNQLLGRIDPHLSLDNIAPTDPMYKAAYGWLRTSIMLDRLNTFLEFAPPDQQGEILSWRQKLTQTFTDFANKIDALKTAAQTASQAPAPPPQPGPTPPSSPAPPSTPNAPSSPSSPAAPPTPPSSPAVPALSTSPSPAPLTPSNAPSAPSTPRVTPPPPVAQPVSPPAPTQPQPTPDIAAPQEAETDNSQPAYLQFLAATAGLTPPLEALSQAERAISVLTQGTLDKQTAANLLKAYNDLEKSVKGKRSSPKSPGTDAAIKKLKSLAGQSSWF